MKPTFFQITLRKTINNKTDQKKINKFFIYIEQIG